MFKVFALSFVDGAWKKHEAIEVVSKADAKTASRGLRRKYRALRPLVLTFPVGDVPAYVPS